MFHQRGIQELQLPRRKNGADLQFSRVSDRRQLGWSLVLGKFHQVRDRLPVDPQRLRFLTGREVDQGVEMPLTNLDTAVKSHEVIFAADRSATLGRPVQLTEVR